MAFITNFQGPVELDDLIERFDTGGLTNIDILINDSPADPSKNENNTTEWTVDRNASIGETVFFMCAKSSVDHMGHVRAAAKRTEDPDLIDFAEQQYQKYRKYAGKIVAIGTICDTPFQEHDSGYEHAHWRSPWYAKIHYTVLSHPVSIDLFRSFITVSRTGSITKLSEDQDAQLLSMIGDDNVEVAPALSLKQLLFLAKKRGKKTVPQTAITTTQYSRDPFVTAYAKSAAGGICELCRQPAPFMDKKGNPYLETHHVVWLSNGGADTIDNTVALCPNCHRKMHIVSSQNDIIFLLQVIKNRQI